MDARDIPSDSIRDWLLEEIDDGDVNDDTSDEEDCVEEDNVQTTDSGEDDSDKDPDWDPDANESNFERILHRRQKRSFVEFCDEDLHDSSMETSQATDGPQTFVGNNSPNQNGVCVPAPPVDASKTSMPSTSTADDGNVLTQENGLSCSRGRLPLRVGNTRGRPRTSGSMSRARGNRRGGVPLAAVTSGPSPGLDEDGEDNILDQNEGLEHNLVNTSDSATTSTLTADGGNVLTLGIEGGE